MSDLRDLAYNISFNEDTSGLQETMKAEKDIDKGLKAAAESATKMSGNLNDIGKSAKTAATNGKEIEDELKKVSSSAGKMGKEFEVATDKADDTADATGKIGDKAKKSEFNIKSLGKAIAGAFVVNKVVDFGKKGVAAFTDFEQGMANVNAAMGNIGGKSPKEFKMLENAALEWGAKTKYSATEASQALYFTASAGFDAKTQVEVLPKVLNLAAAGNIDLAKSAEISTTSMGALGLGVNDLGKLIDQMARASQISQTDIAQLGEGVLTVGGVAKDANLDMTGLNAELAILADKGKKGAEGGTALRNVLLNLTAPNDTVAQLMKELGVNIADSTGKIRPLNSILVDLRKKMSGYTQAQQMAIKETIGGKENIQALNILLEGAGDKYDSLTDRIKDSTGASEEMANVQNNTLRGAIENLTGSIESAFITDIRDSDLGKSMAEFVNLLADKVPGAVESASSALKGLTDIFIWVVDNGDEVSSGITGILTAILAYKAIGTIVEIYNKWKKATEGLTIAQGALNLIMQANPIAIVISLVAGLAAGLIFAYNHSEKFRQGLSNLWEGMKSGAETAINFVIDKLNWAIDKANGLIGLINKVPGVNIGPIGEIEKVALTDKGNKKKLPMPTKTSGGIPLVLPGVPKFAKGGTVHSDTMAITDEEGGELKILKDGTTVVPHDLSKRYLNKDNGTGGGIILQPSFQVIVSGAGNATDVAAEVDKQLRQQFSKFLNDAFGQLNIQLGYVDVEPSN